MTVDDAVALTQTAGDGMAVGAPVTGILGANVGTGVGAGDGDGEVGTGLGKEVGESVVLESSLRE